MKLKLFLIIVLIVAGGGAIFVSFGGLASRAAETTYLTSAAVVGDVSDDVAATGAIETVASYGLAFGALPRLIDASSSAAATGSGTWPVALVSVAVGDHVTKGQSVATADTTSLRSQLSGAIASRRSAALQLEIAQEKLDAATTTDTIRQAKISLYQAQSQLVQAEASQHDLESQVASATLLAPIDGVVTAVNITKGEDAPSGDAIVIDTTTYQVTADVVESDVGSIRVGQPATVTVAAIASDIDGTVASIAPTATTATSSSSVVSYPVTVTLGSAPAGLRSGMTADVTITTASAANVLTVPSAALRTTNGTYSVRVLSATGTAETREVSVGLVTSTTAEITAGLTAGEPVITGTAAERAATTTTNGGGFGGGFGGPGGGFQRGNPNP
jgi:macrolide-specific efflux system membrane fusion protein